MDIRRGDIWYIEAGRSIGSEQRGGRPAIVVSNDCNNRYSGVVEIVYLTTAPKKELPTHVTIHGIGNTKKSTALCEQITVVPKERLTNLMGRVTKKEMQEIETAMEISLGLKTGKRTKSVMKEDEHKPVMWEWPEAANGSS